MQSACKVSVVITTYNGHKYIGKQLESILSQTRLPDEIVIFDDNSSDCTLDAIQRIDDPLQLVKLVKNPNNLGINENFRRALLHSTGDVVFISDQDDIWEANKIALMLEGRSTEMLTYSNASIIGEDDEPICDLESTYFNFTPVNGKAPSYFLLNNCVSGHNALITRELISIACKESFPSAMLYDQWLAYLASLNSGIKYLDFSLCKHRIHSNNANNNLSKPKQKKGNKLERFLNKSRLNSELYNKIARATPTDSNCFEVVQLLQSHYDRIEQIGFNFKLYCALSSTRKEQKHLLNTKKDHRKLFKLCVGRKLWWLSYL